VAWGYAGVLYWATMYLTHHYLVDVVGGACLAVACFYFFLPPEWKETAQATQRSKYEIYDLEVPHGRSASPGLDSDLTSEDESGQDITYRSPRVPGTPASGRPFTQDAQERLNGRGHRHTASIASLIKSDNQGNDAWGPIGSRGFITSKEETPLPR